MGESRPQHFNWSQSITAHAYFPWLSSHYVNVKVVIIMQWFYFQYFAQSFREISLLYFDVVLGLGE